MQLGITRSRTEGVVGSPNESTISPVTHAHCYIYSTTLNLRLRDYS